MTLRRLGPFRTIRVAGPVVVLALLLAPGLVSAGVASAPRSDGATAAPRGPVAFPTPDLAALELAPRSIVPDAPSDLPPHGAAESSNAPQGSLSVVVSFRLSNETRLHDLLTRLADPIDGSTVPFLSRSEFDAQFGGSVSAYRAAAEYFGATGARNLSTFSDRATLTFDAPATRVAAMFATEIHSYRVDGRVYDGAVGPALLPGPIAQSVVQVEGLGDFPGARGHSMTEGFVSIGHETSHRPLALPSGTGYLPPVTLGTAQIEYAPDLQVALDEPSLLGQFGNPANATVALVTAGGLYNLSYSNTTRCAGGGSLSPGQLLGAWNPADLSTYFSETLPTGEPAPVVTGVPLGAAVKPGCLASWDTTGAVSANTVDLEMIGSTAPGARILGVYGSQATPAALDAALATALSPGAPLSPGVIAQLGNVSVLDFPWGFQDRNDSAWFATYLPEAAARGITIVAPTGDSANDPASARWVGSAAEFPASMAYAAFGTLAVGGTTVRLNPASLQIAGEVAWNLSAKDTAQGGPAGTAGGISGWIKEPAWQKSSSANSVIAGAGRGVPDVSAPANNTAATVTRFGFQWQATNASVHGKFFNASGTGVAASLVAGLLAEVDHALGAEHNKGLGFATPTLYSLANAEYAPLPSGLVHGAYYTPSYTSPLPALPFRDVTSGRNFDATAAAGYDLVSGWGSPDAYNLTLYLIVPPSYPAYGPLRAVQSFVNFTALDLQPNPPSTTPVFSVQQNLFLADSLGAPLVWVQSVAYFTNKGGGNWAVNLTGWVVFPFWGIYPTESVYEFWYPATGHTDRIPINLDLTAYITPERPSWDTVVSFGYGGSTSPFSLLVPGAAYLMGAYDHTYSWQGSSYTNGPSPGGSVRGFLAPQVGLYGYPGSGAANVTAGTSGTIASYVEPLGATSFEAAQTSPVLSGANQTAEYSKNLGYVATGPNTWSLGYVRGSVQQGISVAEPFRYPVTFSESGATGSVGWSVVLPSGVKLTGTGNTPDLSVGLENGTYAWSVTIASKNYTVSTPFGNVTVAGAPLTVNIVFVAKLDTVTFEASGGMPLPFDWTVLILGSGPVSGSGTQLAQSLTYAKYSYHVSCANSSWAPKRANGTFTIGSSPVTVQVPFALVTFKVQITPVAAAGVLVPWHVTVAGQTKVGYATKFFNFFLINGSYSYNVSGLPAGYRASPAAGTFVVHGSPAPVILVHIVPPPGNGSGLFGLGIWGYALVGGAGVAAVLGWLLLRRRRPTSRVPVERKPAPLPPRRRPPRTGRGRSDRYLDPDQI